MRASTSLIAIVLLCVSMASTAPLPLLFVGNSYTYYNDLPSLVRNMLDDGSPPPTSCGADGDAPSLTAFRWTIGGHFWRQDLEEVSNSTQALYGYLRPPSKWRFVIYQEQSVTPSLWTCANSEQEAAWSASSTAILGLSSLSQALEGSPPSILYETWGRQHSLDLPGVVNFPDYLSMQNALIEGYSRYNASLHQFNYQVTIAPVGHAMRIIHQDANAVTPFDSMYFTDGSHPSFFGSYLAALIISSRISGASPASVAYLPQQVTAEQAAYLKSVAVQAYAQIGVTFADAPTQAPQNTTAPPRSAAPTTAPASAAPATPPPVASTTPATVASTTPATVASTTPSTADTSTPEPLVLRTPLWAWLLGAIAVALLCVTGYGVYFRRHHRAGAGGQVRLEEVNVPLSGPDAESDEI